MSIHKHLRRFLMATALLFGLDACAQKTPEAYKLYDHAGKEITYQSLIKALSEPDVVFIGEMHNCVVTHWLELKILQSLHAIHGKKLEVGMEMFEADTQLIIDEYLNNTISGDRFEEEARIWPNYSTDYAPIVYYVKDNRLPLIATNVPRRYANVVKNRGMAYLDSLSSDAKRYLPPLPIRYVANANAASGFAMMGLMGKNKGADPERMAQAQAIKDATMGWFIAKNLHGKFLHFNGSYHSDAQEGIIPYLLQYRPGTTFTTIRAVRQEDISYLEDDYKGLADYYICVPEDMTTSY